LKLRLCGRHLAGDLLFPAEFAIGLMNTGGPKQFGPLRIQSSASPDPASIIATPGATFEATTLAPRPGFAMGSQWAIGSRVFLSSAGGQYYGKYVDIG
jgi:hypothetical protein